MIQFPHQTEISDCDIYIIKIGRNGTYFTWEIQYTDYSTNIGSCLIIDAD